MNINSLFYNLYATLYHILKLLLSHFICHGEAWRCKNQEEKEKSGIGDTTWGKIAMLDHDVRPYNCKPVEQWKWQ